MQDTHSILNHLQLWLDSKHQDLPEADKTQFAENATHGMALLLLHKTPANNSPAWYTLHCHQDALDTLSDLNHANENTDDYWIFMASGPQEPPREITPEELDGCVTRLPVDYLDLLTLKFTDPAQSPPPNTVHPKESLKWHLHSEHHKNPTEQELTHLYAALINLNQKGHQATLGESRKTIQQHAQSMTDLPPEKPRNVETGGLQAPHSPEPDDTDNELPF